jgi:hypothetical protein
VNKKVSYPSRIYLNQSKVANLWEFVHFFIENFVLMRFMYFKNRPRNTYLLFRAFISTGAIFLSYYLLFSSLEFIVFGIDVEPILLFAGFGTLGYWNMYATFQKKCEYASGLFNDFIKEQAKDQLKVADRLALNLSIQLLYLDLWGHRMYTDVMLSTIEKAASYMSQNFPDKFDEREVALKLHSKNMRVGELRYLLICYQRELLFINQKQSVAA